MGNEPLVIAEIGDQFRTSGRECEAWMKMSLMDGESCIDCRAATVNNSCARKCQVDQSGPEEIERHLVSYTRCRRSYRTELPEIIGNCSREEALVSVYVWTVPLRPATVPEI